MAKPIAGRQLAGRSENTSIPMLKVDEPMFWSPPKGLLSTARRSRVPIEYCADVKNLMLSEQTLRSRFGTVYWHHAAVPIMAEIAFVTPDQIGYMLELTTTQLLQYTGSGGYSVVYTGFTGGTTDYWTFANWGDEIMMCNGVDKIFAYRPQNGTYKYLEESVPAKHISVFGGRVIETNTIEGSDKPYRVRWSVKLDNEDWDGEGSGWEDLFGAPGGRVDTAHGCFPVTDDTALVIREQSVWQMSTTGQLLAPFRFSRLTSELGTRCRRSIAEVPGGYVFVSKDNIVLMGLNGVERIGDQVRETLIPSITDWDGVVAKYDPIRSEYRLAVGDIIWRYSWREGGWTKDQYPHTIRDMSRTDFQHLGKSIDSLLGTIDSLTGSIDSQVTNEPVDGLFLVEYQGNNSIVVREFEGYDGDVGTALNFVNAEISAVTGLIQAGSVRDKSKVVEIQMEYESGATQTLIFEYSPDGGTTWTPYSTANVAYAVGPQILSVRKTIVGHNIQLRVRSSVLGLLRILSFTPRIVQEAKVHP